MGALQEFKCPCCGADVEFDSASQKMKCPYCGSEFEMESLKAYDDELAENSEDHMEWKMGSTDEWSDGEADGMGVYSCQSCGGEVMADENTAASFCPYCGNPVVMKGSIAGSLKPEFIIPFKLDKKAAVNKFAEHLKGKKLLPKVFKNQNHIEEIKGIYVPYWLFDTKADAKMRYKATKVKCWSDSRYNYTKTSYYAVMKNGDITFEHVPVDGSSKMPDDLMESIEPFDFTLAVPFQSAYFSGYYADKYDMDENISANRANERVRNATEDRFMQSVTGYSSVIPDGGSINLSGGKATYAMYPVWLLTTKWNDENYLFAMNGQTGKFVGNLPMDKGAFVRYLLATFGIVSALLYIIMIIIWVIM